MMISLTLNDVRNRWKLEWADSLTINLKYMIEPGNLVEVETVMDRGRIRDYQESTVDFWGDKVVWFDYEESEHLDLNSDLGLKRMVVQNFVWVASLVAEVITARN